MEGRDQLRAAVVEHAAAQPRDRLVGPQQRLRRELAERDDHLRLDDVDLPEQERLAGLDFVRLGVAVLRRPALDHVRDVDVVALEADRLDDLRQQLPGAADERDALDVFVRARAPRRRTSGRRSGLPTPNTICVRPERVQLAARAVADVGADGGERLGGAVRERDRLRRGSAQQVRWRSARRSAGVVGSAPSPRRVAADAGDAELGGEPQMFGELIAIHQASRSG